jgi:hypothetical protein
MVDIRGEEPQRDPGLLFSISYRYCQKSRWQNSLLTAIVILSGAKNLVFLEG